MILGLLLQLSTALPPNVLFVYLDDVPATFMEDPKVMPALRELASRGTYSPNAYACAPVCNPSRIALLSGRYPHETGYWNNGDRMKDEVEVAGVPVLPYFLKQHGYHTGGAGKIFHHSHFHPDAWDESHLEQDDPRPAPDAAPGILRFGAYDDRPDEDGNRGRMREAKHVDRGRSMMTSLAAPWFVAVGFHIPHLPVVYPQSYADRFPAAEQSALPAEEAGDWRAGLPEIAYENSLRFEPPYSDDEATGRRELIAAMKRATRYVDDQLARLVQDVDFERTVVVVVVDHGFATGEHGRYGKGRCFDPECRAPFLIVHPGGRARVVDLPIDHTAVYPTLARLLGLEVPEKLRGRERSAWVTGDPEAAATDVAYSMCDGRGGARCFMVRTRQFKLIVWPDDDARQLYDLEADPGEYRDLAGLPKFAAPLQRHLELLGELGLP